MKGGSHRPTAFGWINHSEDNGETVAEVGGAVVPLTAANDLNVGDAVIVSADDSVDKSIVAADLYSVTGIVVGGDSTYGQVLQDDSEVGMLAAKAGEKVLVAVSGIVKVVASAAIAAGVNVTPDTVTAGQVKAATITTDLAAGDSGRIVGILLNAAAGAGSIVRMLISRK